MTSSDSSERDAIMARLAQTRSEISRLLEPPPAPRARSRHTGRAPWGGISRSRTMRALMSGRGSAPSAPWLEDCCSRATIRVASAAHAADRRGVPVGDRAGDWRDARQALGSLQPR